MHNDNKNGDTKLGRNHDQFGLYLYVRIPYKPNVAATFFAKLSPPNFSQKIHWTEHKQGINANIPSRFALTSYRIQMVPNNKAGMILCEGDLCESKESDREAQTGIQNARMAALTPVICVNM